MVFTLSLPIFALNATFLAITKKKPLDCGVTLVHLRNAIDRKEHGSIRSMSYEWQGKVSIPLAVYMHLTSILHKSPDPEHIAARLFLILDWNLTSIADVVAQSNI